MKNKKSNGAKVTKFEVKNGNDWHGQGFHCQILDLGRSFRNSTRGENDEESII